MRILYVAHSFGSWRTGDNVWDRNLKNGLIQLGHDVIEPSYDQNEIHTICSQDRTGEARERYSEQFVNEVLSHLKGKGIDLVFTYFDNRHVLPESIIRIRDAGALTINWFCNAAHQFSSISQVAPSFDYCMVPEKVAMSKYKAIGATPIYIPMAADPVFYHPYSNTEEIYDGCFIGNKYYNREVLLLNLIQNGFDVRIFGTNWVFQRLIVDSSFSFPSRIRSYGGDVRRRVVQALSELRGKKIPGRLCSGPIEDTEMVKLSSVSKITLGLSDVILDDGSVMKHVRLRDFEAPMSGACYLTAYLKELESFYEIGTEIDCYSSEEEFLDKFRFYINNDAARKALRTNGRRRAETEHTWSHRFKKLFDIIGIK